jgi:hypothetical protein
MALQRLSIDDVTAVQPGQTSTIVSVSNSQTTFVRTLILHASSLDTPSPDAPAFVQVHVVPGSGGSVGSASSNTRIARVNIAANDTFFVEPEYPIILDTNGDSIQVTNEGGLYGGANSYAINVLAMGDREE